MICDGFLCVCVCDTLIEPQLYSLYLGFLCLELRFEKMSFVNDYNGHTTIFKYTQMSIYKSQEQTLRGTSYFHYTFVFDYIDYIVVFDYYRFIYSYIPPHTHIYKPTNMLAIK